MSKLSDLPNIGKVLEEQLNAVGIENLEQLKANGSKEAWQRIKEIDESACVHRLYAIEGAIQGIKKSGLSDDVKKELKDFYNGIQKLK